MIFNCSVRFALIVAAGLLAGASRSSSDDAPLHPERQQASDCFDRGDFAGALAHLDTFVAGHPEDAEGLAERGYIRMIVKQYAASWIDLDRANTLRPGDPEILAHRGATLGELGEWDRALADLDESIRLDPEFPDAYGIRAYVLAAKRDVKRSRADCDQATKLLGEVADIHQTRAFCHLVENRPDLAILELDQALRLEPANLFARSNRAKLLLVTRQYDQAIADLDQVVTTPDTSGLLALRAEAHFLKGQPDQALRDDDEVIRRKPQDAQAWADRALFHATQGHDEAALSDATEAIRLAPGSPLMPAVRGVVHLLGGRADSALVDLDAAIRLNPNEGRLYHWRACARQRTHDAAGTLADLTHLGDLSPDDPFDDAALAQFLATTTDPKLRDASRALKLANRAVDRTAWRDLDCLAALAAAQASLGNFPAAITAAEAALQLPLRPRIDFWVDSMRRRRKLTLGSSFRLVDDTDFHRTLAADLAQYRLGKPAPAR